ncbi:MAG: hypothetical protein ACI4TU_02225 [Candidatus Cryptobacteroides sp.]
MKNVDVVSDTIKCVIRDMTGCDCDCLLVISGNEENTYSLINGFGRDILKHMVWAMEQEPVIIKIAQAAIKIAKSENCKKTIDSHEHKSRQN